MKRNNIIIIAIGVMVLWGIFLTAACTNDKKVAEQEEHTEAHAAPDSSGKEILSLTDQDERHANIRIDTVRTKSMAEFSTVLGTANFDQRKLTVITSRIRGRLDKLFVRNPQQYVREGEPIYAIYSEELIAYENELLTAIQMKANPSDLKVSFDQLIEAARKKLFLLGLTNFQIEQIEKSGVASALVTFYSPVSGTLTDLPVSEGQYVEEGTAMFSIADMSRLWIEAQMYVNELKWLDGGAAIQAEFDALPGEIFTVVPVFDNPSLEADSKISLVRFQVENPTNKLRPGMMAYISIKRNEKKTMVIPKSSIVVGEMISAWVKTAKGTYENRMIQLGIQNKKEVEVLSGLKEGELIVTNGAYLLNSELILKKGTGMPGMEGMDM
ncbi:MULTISPECIES: efflux RND transporter periplasmic adaptor subunit [Daejeonella]|uniref:Membrane fusion protein, Cu(I)/Ag(I) efflux system n=1 Tax=Daejeonella rubra TaxID=990371 RepID=A0A1G9NN64_9SPHI|nr:MULTISPECIES: efflux RND transporter periplasmic adaptor subunit [Daejeonella]SDL88032.1 membrane fusion protein, Cu(I)/Ag(I) efflux system [Daejeonella rubra]